MVRIFLGGDYGEQTASLNNILYGVANHKVHRSEMAESNIVYAEMISSQAQISIFVKLTI